MHLFFAWWLGVVQCWFLRYSCEPNETYDVTDIFPAQAYLPIVLVVPTGNIDIKWHTQHKVIHVDNVTRVIAGAANNQLAEENVHGALLQQKGIVYAPDFLINAGGIINVYAEIEGYGREQITQKTENIYNTTLDILNRAKATNVTTNEAAIQIAEDRMAARKAEQK